MLFVSSVIYPRSIIYKLH